MTSGGAMPVPLVYDVLGHLKGGRAHLARPSAGSARGSLARWTDTLSMGATGLTRSRASPAPAPYMAEAAEVGRLLEAAQTAVAGEGQPRPGGVMSLRNTPRRAVGGLDLLAVVHDPADPKGQPMTSAHPCWEPHEARGWMASQPNVRVRGGTVPARTPHAGPRGRIRGRTKCGSLVGLRCSSTVWAGNAHKRAQVGISNEVVSIPGSSASPDREDWDTLPRRSGTRACGTVPQEEDR